MILITVVSKGFLMLYFLHFLSDGGDIFNLFRYITFRAGGAFFTSLAFGFLFSKPIIDLLKKKTKGWSANKR